MRRTIVFGLLAALFGSILGGSGEAGERPATNAQLGKLRHVVLFKFKDDTPAEKVKAVIEAFAALPKKIPTIVDYEWGTDVSVENLDQGFTHCFLVTFNDAKGRAVYLPHPAHKKLVDLLKPHLDKVLVIDYVVKR